MANELNLPFKKLILLMTLTVILGVSLVYGVSYEFAPENSPQKTRESSGSTSSGSSSSGSSSSDSLPPPGLCVLISGYLRVFAYYAVEQPDGSIQGGFVQSSVTVTGPENFTGTTTTDVQNPLTFIVSTDGRYSVLGTYGSLPPQNATIELRTPLWGAYFWVVLNFGSSPPPPICTISVSAYYESVNNESLPVMVYENGSWTRTSYKAICFEYGPVNASVVVTGPENFTGTTIDEGSNTLTFTVVPGQYSVTVTYGSLPPQKETINVLNGDYWPVTVRFGSGPPPP
jgi:hypothetical protein